tara:strand:- start:243 stop:497 length:255 start_codon:yes stop_codon:yes gene_type:complete
MDKTIYLTDIDNLLSKCNSHHSYQEKKTSQKNQKKPYMLKQFQSMYQKFLFKKELKQKNTNQKKENITLISSYDEVINQHTNTS